jgi:hypothetical protein
MPSGLLVHSGGFLVVADAANGVIYAFKEGGGGGAPGSNKWSVAGTIDTGTSSRPGSIMGVAEAPEGGGILYTDTLANQVYAAKFCNLS